MYKKIQLVIITFSVLILTLISNVSALDTTECFTPGILTELEGYYNFDWDNDTKSPSGEILIGGGVTEAFSYLITGTLSYENPEGQGKVKTFEGIGFRLIWTIIEVENFALDLMPAFSIEPNDVADNEKSIKPNFKGYSYGGSLEVNLMVIEMFQPYLNVGYTNYHNTSENGEGNFTNDPYEFPLSIGAMIPLKEGVQLLTQFDWTLNEDTKKMKETERSIAIGINLMLTGNLEFTLEYRKGLKIEDGAGNEVSPRSWGIGFGAIYGL